MATSLNVTVDNKVSGTFLNPLSAFTGSTITFSGAPVAEFVKSFAATDVSKIYIATRSAAATADLINLANGSLLDGFNQALTFTSLKYVYIKNKDASNSLTLFGGLTPVLANTLTLTAGGNLSLVSTYTVDSTHKLISVDPGSATISYDIVLVGN